MADARDVAGAVFLPCPELAGAQPAGAGFIRGVVSVPVELDFDATVGICPDFLLSRANDGGGLTERTRFVEGTVGYERL